MGIKLVYMVVVIVEGGAEQFHSVIGRGHSTPLLYSSTIYMSLTANVSHADIYLFNNQRVHATIARNIILKK
jgi:hypothetical protein